MVVVKGKAAESQSRNPKVAVPISLSQSIRLRAMSDISKDLPVVDLDIFLAGPPASESVIKECKKVGRCQVQPISKVLIKRLLMPLSYTAPSSFMTLGYLNGIMQTSWI